MKLRTKSARRIAYVNRVITLLSDEFEWDDLTRDTCRNQLIHPVYDSGFVPQFEFICDSPMSALWRLKAAPKVGQWGLRMSFYGYTGAAGTKGAEELTDQLAEIYADELG